MEAARSVAEVLRWAWIAAACTSTAIGCGSGPETFECSGAVVERDVRPLPLADLPDLRVSVHYSAVHGARLIANGRALGFQVGFGQRVGNLTQVSGPLSDHGDRYCPLPDPSFKVTLDGTEPFMISPGDWACLGVPGAGCGYTRAEIADPDVVPDAQLVLEDRSQTISVPLGDALLERSVMLVGGTDWTFRPRQVVTVRWSPASDLAAGVAPEVSFDENCTEADCTSPFRAFTVDQVVQRGDDTFELTLPDVSNTGMLVFELGSASDRGVYALSKQHAVYHTAKIAP